MLLILIGPPGAGKGTQAKRLESTLAVPHLSTGDLLRQNIQAGSELGALAEPIISRGGLVPDHLVTRMVATRLDDSDCEPGCLLDGFPRTLRQAESLDELLTDCEKQVDLVVELSVPDKVLIDRLLERAKSGPTPRADDTPATIPRRLEAYHLQTEPILDYYRQQQLLDSIDGLGTMDEVFERIMESVRAVRSRLA